MDAVFVSLYADITVAAAVEFSVSSAQSTHYHFFYMMEISELSDRKLNRDLLPQLAVRKKLKIRESVMDVSGIMHTFQPHRNNQTP